MTNPKPLSPAAQAVMDAYANASDGEYVEGVWIVNECTMLADALRAAADQVVPEYETTPGGSKIWPSEPVSSIRRRFLAIADELENHNG